MCVCASRVRSVGKLIIVVSRPRACCYIYQLKPSYPLQNLCVGQASWSLAACRSVLCASRGGVSPARAARDPFRLAHRHPFLPPGYVALVWPQVHAFITCARSCARPAPLSLSRPTTLNYVARPLCVYVLVGCVRLVS